MPDFNGLDKGERRFNRTHARASREALKASIRGERRGAAFREAREADRRGRLA